MLRESNVVLTAGATVNAIRVAIVTFIMGVVLTMAAPSGVTAQACEDNCFQGPGGCFYCQYGGMPNGWSDCTTPACWHCWLDNEGCEQSPDDVVLADGTLYRADRVDPSDFAAPVAAVGVTPGSVIPVAPGAGEQTTAWSSDNQVSVGTNISPTIRRRCDGAILERSYDPATRARMREATRRLFVSED
jgi:hypothetical protein